MTFAIFRCSVSCHLTHGTFKFIAKKETTVQDRSRHVVSDGTLAVIVDKAHIISGKNNIILGYFAVHMGFLMLFFSCPLSPTNILNQNYHITLEESLSTGSRRLILREQHTDRYRQNSTIQVQSFLYRSCFARRIPSLVCH